MDIDTDTTLLQHFLQRFGYMNESTDAAQNLISENTYSHALAEFQRFAGLNETGKSTTKIGALTDCFK